MTSTTRRIGVQRPAKRLTGACRVCRDYRRPVVRFNLNVPVPTGVPGKFSTRGAGSTLLCVDCHRLLTYGLTKRRPNVAA